MFVARREFPGLAFRRFLMKHLKKVRADLSPDLVKLYLNFCQLSGECYHPRRNIIFVKHWNTLHINMLNSNGKLGPQGVPTVISDQEIEVPFKFTICFGIVQYECNGLKK